MNGNDRDEKQEVLEDLVPFFAIGLWLLISIASTVLVELMVVLLGGSASLWALLGIFILALIGWGVVFALKMLQSVEATRRGVIELFGRLTRTVGPGLKWIWRPFEKLFFVPLELLELEMFFQDVMTRPGNYVWNEGTPQEETERCERLALGVGLSVYLQFGDDEENLFQALSVLPSDIFSTPMIEEIKERLTKFLDSDVDGAMRIVGGGSTYAEVVDHKGDIETAIRGILLHSEPFKDTGLGNTLRVAIRRVVFPPEFLAAQTAKAVARENAEAARRDAEGKRDADIAAAEATAKATELQAVADLTKVQKAADGERYKVEQEAKGEAARVNETLAAIGLQPGEQRANYLLGQMVATNLGKDANLNIISSDVQQAVQGVLGAVAAVTAPKGSKP